MTRAQRRMIAAALAALAVAAGLLCRLGSIPLPYIAYKYGGSMLWAMAIYWLFAAAFPRWSVVRAATVTAFVSASFEFFKLYHSPALDAFRLTVPGKLIFGRFFSWKDLAAYGLAIAVTALLDNALFRPRLARHD